MLNGVKMKYFGMVNTAEEAKSLFRELAKKLHPDKGGSEAEFKAMVDEYEEFIGSLNSSPWQKQEYIEAGRSICSFVKTVKPEQYAKLDTAMSAISALCGLCSDKKIKDFGNFLGKLNNNLN